MKRHRRFIFVGIAVACLLAGGIAFGLQSALATSPSSQPSSASELVLKIGWLEDPDSLNPFIGYAQSAYEIWSLNYDDLTDIGPDGNPVPELAKVVPTRPERRHLAKTARCGRTISARV